MTEEEKKAAVRVALEAAPFETQIGYDVPRTWATGVQFFANAGHVLVVFREQITQVDAEGNSTLHARNVSSVVMPLDVAKEMHTVLGNVISNLSPDAEG